MQLPEELQQAIDHIAQASPALRKAREALSQDYREGRSSPFSDEAKRIAYLGARMPATYAAIHKVLEQVPPFKHLLDLGAGPGTASWAAADLFPDLEKITLIEKSGDAIELGKKLARFSSHAALREANWIQQSVTDAIPNGDVAILSYVLNEIAEPEKVVEACFKIAPILILIEPGTPRGFQIIRKVRQRLIDLGAHILAPCPHAFACPVQGTDWCHFPARVERTRLHRLLKEGSLGYEDEKFSYLVVSQTPGLGCGERVVRHPMKQSGFVRLSLCTERGKLEERTVTKKDRELYKAARDAEWGDCVKL
jgi:ribosomal protein RSM22 (predicted rRNA methylase)